MSKIGKKPIKIPENVNIEIDGQKVKVLGPKGELFRNVLPVINVEKKEQEIVLTTKAETKTANAFWGLERALIQNMVEGVSQGFTKKLELVGIGYKAAMEGSNLILEVGFSHSVIIEIPETINVSAKGKTITISGIDKALVGQIAAKIKKIKPPDPYKGKGIRYLGEEIKLKPGKKATSGI